MDIHQIRNAVILTEQAMRGLKPMLEGRNRTACEHVKFMVSEITHFSECWADQRAREDSQELKPEEAAKIRAELLARLGTSLAPSRL